MEIPQLWIEISLVLLIVLSIAAQLPHTSFIFLRASKLESNSAKKIQAWAFCLIASLAIFIFIYIEILFLAGLAAFVEAVFNIYYYTEDWWQSENGFGKKQRKKRWEMIKNRWRMQWIYFFISVLIPVFMFTFGYLLKNLDKYLS